MITGEVQQDILSAEKQRELARRGINPFMVQEPIETTQPMFTPPESEIGSLGLAEPWRRAAEDLEKDIAVISAAVQRLDVLLKQGETWDEVKGRVGKMEAMLRPAEVKNINTHVVTFDHHHYIHDVPLDYTSETKCEIDFWKGCIKLPEEGDTSPRVDLSGASVVLNVYPEGCKTQERGSLHGLFTDESAGWTAEISGSEQIDVILTVRLPQPVSLNTVEINYVGKIEVKSVSAGGKELLAVDPTGSTWVTEAIEADLLRIALHKEGFDLTGEAVHYFCLQGISAYLRRYAERGSYVSHALPIRGRSVSLATAVSLSPNTFLQSFIGFQRGKDVTWHKVEESEWIEAPWAQNAIEESFSIQAPQIVEYPLLLHTLAAEPDDFSIELYPGYNSWAIDEVKYEGLEVELAIWYELASSRKVSRWYTGAEKTVVLQPTKLYRFYAFIFCQKEARLDGWRPGAPDCNLAVYINNRKQHTRNEVTDLVFEPGWNLIEIVVLPRASSNFNTLFDFRQVGSISSVVDGSARQVDYRDIILSEPTLRNFAVDGRNILVNYGREAIPDRYLCRYYIKRSEPWYLRVMYVMETRISDFSPAVYSYAVHYL